MSEIPDTITTFRELDDWLNANPEFAKAHGIEVPYCCPSEKCKDMIAKGCTVNQLREVLNLPPLEDGDRPVQVS